MNATSDEMNCNCTKEIVDQKMLVYNHCASIQTANYFLSNTALELYENLNAIRKNNSTNCIDHSPKANEMMTSDYNRTEEWCIL